MIDAVLLEPTVITAEDVLTDDRISLEGCICTRSNPPLFLCLLARFRREVAPQAVEAQKRNSVQQRAMPRSNLWEPNTRDYFRLEHSS